ncbi:MAG: YqjD family protein [Rhizobiaceae bacterium]
MAASTRKTSKAAAGEEAVSGATERSLEEDIKQLQKDVAKLTELLAKTGRHSYDTARKAAAVGMDQIKSQGESAYDDFRVGAENLEAQLTEAVREKPVTSLAIAAGVGFLFALLSRR